jgi:thiol-disulfide isomerase/thioredoxin/outer membrane lipoprotein-sorting protein
MRLLAIAVLSILLIGCRAEKSNDESTRAEDLIKWSMNIHRDLKTFQATCEWKISDGVEQGAASRRIVYQAPDKYRFAAVMPDGKPIRSSISDGKTIVEFGPAPKDGGKRYPAAPLTEVGTEVMRNPLLGGTLLYEWFGGSDNYDNVVNVSHPMFLGRVAEIGGEKAQVVKFYGAFLFGNVEALIGLTSGKVYRLEYDSDAMLARMKNDPRAQGVPQMLRTTETYQDIQFDKPVEPKLFVAEAPKGVDVIDASLAGPDGMPKIGSAAPDFEVVALDGKKHKLSEFKGKVVFLDFWATWCAPCRESLPITEELYKRFADQGLVVMAVSNETKDKVAKFWKENRYTMPVYLDAGSVAGRMYGATSIPLSVVIDRQGKISSGTLGLEEKERTISRLKLAGIKVD